MSGGWGQCSFTLSAAEDNESQYRCTQPSMSDTGLCVWHCPESERPTDGFPDTVPPDTKLRGAELANATLRGVEFSAGVDLSDSTFAGATIRECDLARTELDGCDFTDASVVASTFQQAELSEARLDGFTAIDSSFEDAVLNQTVADAGVEFRNSNLDDVVFTRATVDSLTLDDTVATGIDLTETICGAIRATDTDLSDAILITTDVGDIRVEGCRVRGAVIRRTALDTGSFAMCDLRDATLNGTSAVSVAFDATRLSGARCRECTFNDASFRGADLSGTDLTDSDLTGSSLKNADLSGAVLDGATLQESDLSGVRLQDASINRSTRFPSLTELEQRGLEVPEMLGLYRTLVGLLEDEDLTDAAFRRRSEYYTLQRRQAQLDGQYGRYFGLLLNGVVTGHGQRPARVLTTSIVVVAYFAVVYTTIGIGVVPGETDLIGALVFSLQAFSPGVTTSVVEATRIGTMLVTIESTIGLVLLGVFAVLVAQRLQTL
ncbi:pentapeptide repeat-containing protein [Halorubrum ezzemoulense]|uniref:pentapeptide repeat-containing protein n=1 Tax=Halorubrum ezzemoulense TaxID=337243 RepID=UPI00232D14AA|nr:pentapeptide repeat-containing protein [Halorubrum ezzemoulense]MDB2262471.1 pentapeptide repeat-containing protein [Halorubrum ezzemoulense]MDB2269306.1 pentapeptide repeat-containing protein [Halorubrum ezzemoulense]